MQLTPLRRTACLTVYYDASNDWLFLDWQGELTLPAVQEACLALADCFLLRPYARVLNSNDQVTNLSWGIVAWLATEFLPHVGLAGIQHVAWVHSASLLGQHMVQAILNWLPGPYLSCFSDLEGASEWLKHLRPAQGFTPAVRSPAAQARLAAEVVAFRQRLAAKQPQSAPRQSLAA